jgi:TolB-like protein
MAVLEALAKRDGDLVTRDELVDEVWDGRPTADEPINRCISLLRRHLGDTDRPHRYIETLTRRGYRLNQRVQLKEPAATIDLEVIKAHRARNQGRIWILVGAIAATMLFAVLIRGLQGPAAPEEVRSLGVLPFEFLSDIQGDQYIAQGLQEEVVRTLQGAPRLAVKIGRRKYEDLEVSDIGRALDVDALLFATLQRENETLKLGYRISEAANGVAISAGDIMGSVEDMFGLQERFANLILEDMLGKSEQKLVSLSRPASHEAYDRYMRGLVAFDRRSQGTNLDDALALFEETIRIDPMFGPAYRLCLQQAKAICDGGNGLPESHRG